VGSRDVAFHAQLLDGKVHMSRDLVTPDSFVLEPANRVNVFVHVNTLM